MKSARRKKIQTTSTVCVLKVSKITREYFTPVELTDKTPLNFFKKIVKTKFLNITLVVFYWLSMRLCWLVSSVRASNYWYFDKRFQVATGRLFLAIQSQENNLRNIWKSDYLSMLIFGVGNWMWYNLKFVKRSEKELETHQDTICSYLNDFRQVFIVHFIKMAASQLGAKVRVRVAGGRC